MVYLALTRKGCENFISLRPLNGALWVPANVLTEEEIAGFRSEGIDISDFNYTIDLSEFDVISGAIETIKEHYPSKVVWIEA